MKTLLLRGWEDSFCVCTAGIEPNDADDVQDEQDDAAPSETQEEEEDEVEVDDEDDCGLRRCA